MSHKLETELSDYFQEHMYSVRNGFVTYPDHQDFTMPSEYKDAEEQFLNFEVFSDDIWLVSYPKAGATWTQEMVWLLVNNLDYDNAKEDLMIRFPFLELNSFARVFGSVESDKLLDHVKCLKRPRLIKTHLPVGLLPRQLWEVKPKIIYVMREPKDVASSYFNHYIAISGYSGSKDRFFQGFLENHLMWGSYFGNVAPFWNLRDQPNVLLNTYEEMKKDLPGVVERTAKFLGKTVQEDQMGNLMNHLSISSMKDNESINMKHYIERVRSLAGVGEGRHFINEGSVGGHKKEMTAEWNEKFDEWIRQEKIKYELDKDKDFPY